MTGKFIAGFGIGVPFLWNDATAADPNAGHYLLLESGDRIDLEASANDDLLLESAP